MTQKTNPLIISKKESRENNLSLVRVKTPPDRPPHRFRKPPPFLGGICAVRSE